MITPGTPGFPGSPTKAWDLSGWIGPYPFRHLREHTLDDWLMRARRAGVSRAVISGYDQLFAQNGLECWPIWVDRIARHAEVRDRLECWPVVNPAMPGELRRLGESLRHTPARGIRLLPNYHSYRLWDSHVADLMALAREHDLIVQVFIRIVDERWQWMLHTPAVDAAQDIAYLTSIFQQNRLLVSGGSPGELQGMAERFRAHPSLHADISRVRGPIFALDNIDRSLPLHRLVLGTLWPMQIMEASIWEITTSRLSADQQQAILWGNVQALLERSRADQPAVMETTP